MRQAIFTATILVLLATGNAAFAQIPTNGLVAYYPFNNPTATDASGNNRNGSFSGGVSATTDRLGNPSQAYNFDGSTGNITVSNWNILTGNAARTMSLWFKTTVPTAYRMMISWGSIGTNMGSDIGILTDGPNQPNGLGFTAIYDIGLQIGNQNQFYDNNWHSMTFTHDGTIMKLYLDGALQTLRSINTPLNTTSSNLVIGSYNVGGAYYLGAMDEVRIYNRALTQTEVQQLFLAEAPPTSSTAEVIKLGIDRFIHATGAENTFIGLKSGAFSLGTSNTFLGFNTAISNTGSYNTLVGTKAGLVNTTGSNNTFVGYQSGNVNTTGANNVFIGIKAGASNTTGSNNIIVGPNSGTTVTTGNDNILMGYNSRAGDGRGKHNLIIGGESGGGNWSGGSNTLIGYRASAKAPNLENATAIGADARVTISNAVVLGNKANVGIGTSAPKDRLEVVSDKPDDSGLRLTNLTTNSPVTQSTDQFLTVNEKGEVIKARYQLRINDANQWSDKVFSPTYQLRPLTSVASYIDQHKHLPGVPSANEVVKDGIDLVKMNATLLEKVEELTLYSIQLEKANLELKEQQQQDKQQQQARLGQLEKLVNQLLKNK